MPVCTTNRTTPFSLWGGSIYVRRENNYTQSRDPDTRPSRKLPINSRYSNQTIEFRRTRHNDMSHHHQRDAPMSGRSELHGQSHDQLGLEPRSYWALPARSPLLTDSGP